MLFTCSLVGSAFADNNSSAPFVIGASCNETATYSVKVETKTSWAVSNMLAVPEGYLPSEWEGTSAFVSAMAQRIAGSKEIAAMSQALLSQWHESISGSAMIYIMYTRSITTETRNLQCSEGTWQIDAASDHLDTTPDTTQWIAVTTEPAMPGSLTTADLAQTVTTLLATINSQPGADTTSFNTYTKISD